MCSVHTMAMLWFSVHTLWQGPVPLIPDASSKHVDFVDFPTIHPDYKGKPYRYTGTGCAYYQYVT
jgi:hypothetical protein